MKVASSSKNNNDAVDLAGTDNWGVPSHVKENPLFVEVGSKTIIDALATLDGNMRRLNLGHLISAKPVRPFGGVQGKQYI